MAKYALTTIYVVRHGQSNHNAGIFNGEQPHEIPLTPLGEEQARRLGEQLKNINFDAVFSSDFVRAKRTAEIIVRERHLAVQLSSLIRERVFGAGFYSDRERVKAEMKSALIKLAEEKKITYKHSRDMESAKEAGERLMTFLREIAIAYEGKTLLVVCHGNVMRSMLNLLGWCKFDELPEKSIDNTGYIKLECDGTDFFIKETKGVNKKTGITRIM